MSHMVRLILIATLLIALLPAIPAAAAAPALPDYCQQGFGSSGAYYFYCVPPVGWNGGLVAYAHGYVNPQIPLAVQPYPWDQLALPDGTTLVEIVNGLGFAFAASGYSKNGLAVQQGLQDTVELVSIFRAAHPETGLVYLTGASEGGLITTLGVERFPGVFHGGLATCGPVGDFSKQVNYWGDFRVVYDYFFPGVLPPSPVSIPAELMQNWETAYAPLVAAKLSASPSLTSQLLKVTKAPIDLLDPSTIQQTALGLLWYNVYATNDGVSTLGGQPFDNSTRWYTGSYNDRKLNRKVQRFTADPWIPAAILPYQTSGALSVPLVTLHTTGDPIVPYWHIPLYRLKVLASGSALRYTNIPVLRYGHCNFTQMEILVGFAILALQTTGQTLDAALDQLPSAETQAEFIDLARQYGGWR